MVMVMAMVIVMINKATNYLNKFRNRGFTYLTPNLYIPK